ncbi:MAG: hypothetical protein WDO69_34855 [Pseudomonadota bacterium]
MSSAIRDDNAASRRATRRGHLCRVSAFCGAAILTSFVSCSSDSLPGGGDDGDSGHGGSETSAGAANRSGSAGQSGSRPGGTAGIGDAGSGAVGDAGDCAAGNGALGGASGSGGGGVSGSGGGASGTGGGGVSGTGGGGVSGTGGGGASGTSGGGASGSGGGASGIGGSGIGGGGASGTGGGGASGIGGGGASGTGGGGASGTGGAQQGSFTLSKTSLQVPTCTVPLIVTITNTSSIPLTWHVSGDVSKLVITPLGSTIPGGGSRDVSFLPIQGASTPPYLIYIDADIAPSQTIGFDGYPNGTTVVPPADIDFGNVPLQPLFGGSPPMVHIAIPGVTHGILSGATVSGDAAFSLSGVAPIIDWTLTFRPQTLGPHEATVTFINFSGTVCPPNSFKVRGTGVSP